MSWHSMRAHSGRTCFSGPLGWRRACIRCAWRIVTGRNRQARAAHAAMIQRFRDCGHANTRPNPRATAVLDRNPRVCLDCGIGIVDGRR